MVRVT